MNNIHRVGADITVLRECEVDYDSDDPRKIAEVLIRKVPDDQQVSGLKLNSHNLLSLKLWCVLPAPSHSSFTHIFASFNLLFMFYIMLCSIAFSDDYFVSSAYFILSSVSLSATDKLEFPSG